ncbi:MAG: ATP-binding protein [Muribaculaceae bacterium]|nr:ATP-binding protein [Muribaculaceae bacterium]
MESNTQEATSFSIIDSLDAIQSMARKSALSPDFWAVCKMHFDYLCSRFDLNRNQVLIIALMCETGESMSWRNFGQYLGISRLKAMSLTPDIEGLLKKRWIIKSSARECGTWYDGFALTPGIIRAFRQNEVFTPENIENLSEQAFVDRLARYVAHEGHDRNVPRDENNRWMLMLVEANGSLPLCQKVLSMDDEISQITLLLAVVDYARYAGLENEGIMLHELSEWFDDDYEYDRVAELLQNGSHELFEQNILEHACDNGLVDTEHFLLTDTAKEELLGGFTPHKSPRQHIMSKTQDRDLIHFKQISEKTLFYNQAEQRQISRLNKLICQENFGNVQNRLEELGLRKGVACLFYGSPGTGKTESVFQLARQTRRDIMQVNIAGIRDKFVGETEKNIKAIFTRYRQLCRSRQVTPILLFNEADAVINNRFETTRSSVEKMDNAMQNIILQELETLDGILIATTNLTGTLDQAFDRRFLFKIEFNKPDSESRTKIWQSLIPDLSDADCMAIAREFEFSGGQIENIARKSKIEYVLNGKFPTSESIRSFCREENLNRSNRKRIGFLDPSSSWHF